MLPGELAAFVYASLGILILGITLLLTVLSGPSERTMWLRVEYYDSAWSPSDWCADGATLRVNGCTDSG